MEHTPNLLWDVFLFYYTNDEEEVVEEIHANDYNLRSKGAPSTSKSTSITSPTTKNTTASKSSTSSDVANMEYDIVYVM